MLFELSGLDKNHRGILYRPSGQQFGDVGHRRVRSAALSAFGTVSARAHWGVSRQGGLREHPMIR